MTKTDSGVAVGRLSDRVEVQELLKTTGESGTAWTWEAVRKTWALAELMSVARIRVSQSLAWGRRG